MARQFPKPRTCAHKMATWRASAVFQLVLVILYLTAVAAFAYLKSTVPIVGWSIALALAILRLAMIYQVRYSWNSKNWAAELPYRMVWVRIARIVLIAAVMAFFGVGIAWIVFSVMDHDGMIAMSHWPGAVSFFVASKCSGVLAWDFHKSLDFHARQGYAPIVSPSGND